MSESLLEVDHLTKRFGGVTAVDGGFGVGDAVEVVERGPTGHELIGKGIVSFSARVIHAGLFDHSAQIINEESTGEKCHFFEELNITKDLYSLTLYL